MTLASTGIANLRTDVGDMFQRASAGIHARVGDVSSRLDRLDGLSHTLATREDQLSDLGARIAQAQSMADSVRSC